MKLRKAGLLVLASLFGWGTAAHAEGTAIGLHAGLLGFGPGVTQSIVDTVNIRAEYNYFSYSSNQTESNVDYSADFKLNSGDVLLDWYPMEGSFHLSGGLLFNGNKFDMTGRPTSGTYDINGTTYTAAQIGTLSAKVDFDSVAPYLGIGWGNPVADGGHWGVTLDLGVVYQGSPNAKLSATGPIASDATFQSNLAAEQSSLQNSLDNWTFYPVATVGLNYQF